MPQPFHLCQNLGELHAYERLNYVLGQVLGVQDFQQEQFYFLHKARLHNRGLHGYGTVWGLGVSTNGTGAELEIQVSPGFALDTQGREVLVDALQCAPLNTWLTAAVTEGSTTVNRDTLTVVNGKGSVYVTLCYRPCQTGAQPILGDPCRTDSGQEGVIQFTRIRDEFELKLLPQPPLQQEEDQVRAIGDLLAKIEIDPSAPALSKADRATLAQILQDAIDDPARIPGLGILTIPTVQARDLLRELFRYWITITRPTLNKLHNPVLKLLEKISIDDTLPAPTEAEIVAQIAVFTEALDEYIRTKQLTAIDALTPVIVPGEVATRYRRAILQYWSSKPESCQTSEDECILLAEVQFALVNGSVDESTLEVVNLQRPYLLHTRLLQELLLQGILQGPGGVGPQGSQGDPGSAATITIGTVATGEPDTPASVTNSGDAANAVLDFVIPKGNSGEGGTGNPTEISIGNVTSGTPGTAASVTNSGTPTNAVLDFVIPRGAPGDPGTPGISAQISIGTVVPGAPGTNPVVTNTGTPTNAVLNFTIPQGQRGISGSSGEPGLGLDQLILRPIDLMLFNDQRFDNERPEGVSQELPLAIPGTIRGYPALIFDQGQGVAAFSTLRPTSLKAGRPPLLQLYCTGQQGVVSWIVTWRWLRSLSPSEPPRGDGELTTSDFITRDLPPITLQRFHLHRSEPLVLEVSVDEPDFLVAYLVPKANLGGEGEQGQLYLLMAELRWEVS